MNKSELIDRIHQRLGRSFTKKDIEEILNASTNLITEAVASGEEVKLIGFGTYKKVFREATKGRNPKTGEITEIKSKFVPKFIPGKVFREAIIAKS